MWDVALIAFGDLLVLGRVLKADMIFDQLLDNGIWYLRQTSKVVRPGAVVLFYQNAVGIRAFADVRAVGPIKKYVLPDNAHRLFSLQVDLSEIRRFKTPISLTPLVADLTFIANKKFWGQSLRATPRRIPYDDFMKIMARAPKERCTDKGALKAVP